MLLLGVRLGMAQGISVDAPPVVQANVTRVSLSFLSDAAGTSVTWGIPDSQIVWESPNKSTVEVIFTSSGSKNIQAWGYSNATGQAHGTAQIEVIGVPPVYVTGVVRQDGGGVLSGVWVDAQEIGGSGSITAQTQHDGSYNFYVPQGTSWRIRPRASSNCTNTFYPQEVYNVQSTVTANFARYNQLFRMFVSATGYIITVLQGSGQSANFYYYVQYTDGTGEPFACANNTSIDGSALPGKTISFIHLQDCFTNCELFGSAN
jgi:hypothetical protein